MAIMINGPGRLCKHRGKRSWEREEYEVKLEPDDFKNRHSGCSTCAVVRLDIICIILSAQMSRRNS